MVKSSACEPITFIIITPVMKSKQENEEVRMALSFPAFDLLRFYKEKHSL